MKPLRFGVCDHATFWMFTVYAAGSVIVPVVLPDVAQSLGFPLQSGGMGAAGALHAIRSAAMVLAMLSCGFLAARFGIKNNLVPASLLMSCAIAGIIAAPGYGVLMVLMFCAGLGEGIIEALATPAVEQLHYDEEPGRYVNFTHGFWSVGVVLATLGSGLLLKYHFSWKYALLLIACCGMVPAVLYLWRSNQRARLEVKQQQNSGEVWRNWLAVLKNPGFWLFFTAIFFAGGGEWSLTFWLASFLRLEHGASSFTGGAATALFASGMIVGRMFAGMRVRQHDLPKLLLINAVCATCLGIWVPFIHQIWLLLVLAFILGILIGPFWPSIQSVCVDKIKLDSTSIYILLSCAGIPGCGVFTWLQGMLGDIKAIGLSKSFLLMPLSTLIMTGSLIAACKIAGKAKCGSDT